MPDQAPEDRGAIELEGVTLRQLARVYAGMAEGFTLEAMLDHEAVDPPTWPAADGAWMARIADEMSASSAAHPFDVLMAEAQLTFERKVPPLDEDPRAFFDFVRGWSTHPDPMGLLDKLELRPSDVIRLQKKWASAMSGDEKLRERVQELLMEDPGPMPDVAPEPARLPVRAKQIAPAKAAPALPAAAVAEAPKFPGLDVPLPGQGDLAPPPMPMSSMTPRPAPFTAPAPPAVVPAPQTAPAPMYPTPQLAHVAQAAQVAPVAPPPMGSMAPTPSQVPAVRRRSTVPPRPFEETTFGAENPVPGAALPFASRPPALPFASKPPSSERVGSTTSGLPFMASRVPLPPPAIAAAPAPPLAPGALGETVVPSGPILPKATALPFAPTRGEGPASEPTPAAQAPRDISDWTLDGYASLCAELAVFPSDTETTFVKAGLRAAGDRRALDALFRRRLEQDPATYAEWQQMYWRYRTSWSQRPR